MYPQASPAAKLRAIQEPAKSNLRMPGSSNRGMLDELFPQFFSGTFND
jgi:hypothetical protein